MPFALPPRRTAPLLMAIAAVLVAACDGDLLGLGGPPTPSASPSAAAAGSPAPAGSAPPAASPAPAATPTPDPRLPTEPATIEGEVLTSEPATAGELHSGRIKVSTADGSNQAVATIVPATTIWRQGADKALARVSATELRVGQRVRVWAGGPIRESFPIQFDARTVLILPN